MGFSKYIKSRSIWEDSASIAAGILAVIETFLTISSISLECVWGGQTWFSKLLIVIGLFLILVGVIIYLKYRKVKNGIDLNIRGINVSIKIGDIFKANGWRVIAFNEYFDTVVDDVIIAHNTINGKFIDNYVGDIDDLNQVICSETDDYTRLKRRSKNNKIVYPLGRIITYQNQYMLLAFTHFDNNQAHLSQSDFEDCLRKMWGEISRTYANRPVYIPLLGSGITRFDDSAYKSNTDLLKCMLCTLKNSGVKINQPITILLTKETIQTINIYELKSVI